MVYNIHLINFYHWIKEEVKDEEKKKVVGMHRVRRPHARYTELWVVFGKEDKDEDEDETEGRGGMM